MDYQYTHQPHLAVCLPEIVSHILSFLAPAQCQDEPKKKTYVDLYPCLLVNRLWHDSASRIVWRRAYFEDTKEDLATFLAFASVIHDASPVPMLSPSSSTSSSSTSAAQLAIGQAKMTADNVLAEMEVRAQKHMETAARLSTYRNALRVLSIRKMKEKTINEPLARIGQNATKLEHLDIYICDHFSNEALNPFLVHSNLTFLSLAGCHHISDSAILKVAEYCGGLEHLDLRACGLVSDVSLSAVAMQCPRLRHLNVGRIRDRDKVSIKSIALIAQYTQAAVLGLAGCDIDDACMQVLAKHRTTGLERVSVNSCFKISNETVYAYIKYCPNLSVFEMKECHNVNDWEAVAELVQRKVLLTLCDQQNKACADWARLRGRTLDVKAPLK
ncbi:hypothetical protein FB192DRAFT_1335633 [Mucor lusitanicus]|uniref:F-box domain-containing protein n=1 Tax=Mucor circinelloides f. lusitanicus TaxID=29924 RepID=A0A8H4B7K8_MUCCL|nr:hypothetical protein FB192DRAFT_1335633 [Mucor lusitanicus]